MITAEKSVKKGLSASLLALLRARDNIRLRNVRATHLNYMLIFPLAPVFANMQGALFHDSLRLFGLDAMTLMGSAYCLGAGALFACTNTENMARISKLSALLTAAAFVLWLLMPESLLSLLMANCFMFSLGGCAAFAYTFTLNNTERLLGAAAISLFFALNQLGSKVTLASGLFDKSYLAALILGTCLCLSRYRAADFSAIAQKPRAKLNPALKLTLYFFVAHYFVEIFYSYLPGPPRPPPCWQTEASASSLSPSRWCCNCSQSAASGTCATCFSLP